MVGFAINVGESAVFRNAHAGRYCWGGLACDKPLGHESGNFIFGGALDDNSWLEAVRFTA